MPPDADATACLSLSLRFCCAGILWQSLELLPVGRELGDGRLLARDETRHGLRGLEGGRSPAEMRRGLIFLVARAAAAALCLAVPFAGLAGWALVTGLFFGQIYFTRRLRMIFANSDHLTLVCLGALAAAGWPGASQGLRAAALAFLAFQCLLAYLSSGLDKLASGNWRSGARLTAIFQDSAHRVPFLGDRLARRPWLGGVLSWSVILLEVLFPLCVVLPPAGFWAFLAAGLLFHLSIGVLMALPGFFWAFLATYPGLYFLRLAWTGFGR